MKIVQVFQHTYAFLKCLFATYAFMLCFIIVSCKREVPKKGKVESNSVVEKVSVEDILYQLKNPSDSVVLVVSHRGDWRYAPENSVQAVKRCIELGVDIVEIDVRLTKDGYLVAIHDKTVDRTTNGKGKVSDLTLEEIKELRLKNACGIQGSKLQIPTLEEIMLAAKGKIMVNLDKTEGKTVRQAYEVLKKTNTVNHAIFKGNDDYETMYTKYGSLLDSIIYMPKLWYSNKNIETYLETYEHKLNPFIYETIFDSEDAASFRLVSKLKEQGDTFLAISLWSELCAGYTDEKAFLEGADTSWGWLVENGANAIMTDRPEELISYLKKKGLKK